MTYKELEKVNSEMVTIDVKGKPYPEVVEKIKAFKKIYPDGSITTELLSDKDGKAVFKATVAVKDTTTGEVNVLGTGHAYECQNASYINKTSYLENCETSAVGRALSMAGFGSDKSVASLEEVAHAINQQTTTKIISAKEAANLEKTATANQREWALKAYNIKSFAEMTNEQYKDFTDRLKKIEAKNES